LTDESETGATSVNVTLRDAPFSDAVTWVLVSDERVAAVAENVPIVWPAATVTEAGRLNAWLLLASPIPTPPAGAAFVTVTVQVVEEPLSTVDGEQLNEDKPTGAINVRLVETDVPLRLAVNWAVVSAVIFETAAVKLELICPAAMVTELGTATAVLLLARFTAVPPEAAAFDRVIVQAAEDPELTVEGEQMTPETTMGADRVRVVALDDPFNVPVTWAVESAPMFPILALKLPLLCPAATVSVAGTLTVELLLTTAILAPPEGAIFESVAVQTADELDVGVDGVQDRVERSGGEMSVRVALEDPFSVAVTWALESALTLPTLALKVALDWPAATLTAAGTVTNALPLASVTLTPPEGAALDNVAVQLDVAPEFTVDGLHDSEDTPGEETRDRVALDDPFSVAVTWALESALTLPTLALNVAVDWPAAMLIEAGTVTNALPLASVTLAPPESAALDNVTVQLDVAPEFTVEGLHDSEDTFGGATRESVVLTDPLSVALTWAVTSAATAPTDALNVAVLCPAGIATEAGTVTRALFDDTVTVPPPLGAGCVRVIAQDAVPPETTVDGAQVTVPADGTGLTTIVAVALFPPPEAVIGTAVELLTVPAVAVKLALALPPGIATVEGTEITLLALEMLTVIPVTGAFWLNCTLHVVDPPGASADELHVRAETAGLICVVLTSTVPPVASTDTADASTEDAIAWLILIVRDELVEAAGTTVTVATTPLPMVAVFRPKTIQVNVPFPGLQVTDLAATKLADPGATVITLKSAALYASVNCKPAGFTPAAGAVSVIASVTGKPAIPDPEARFKVKFCEKAGAVAKANRSAT
jgi:hypothetical protein